jgi:hypothetical protein
MSAAFNIFRLVWIYNPHEPPTDTDFNEYNSTIKWWNSLIKFRIGLGPPTSRRLRNDAAPRLEIGG